MGRTGHVHSAPAIWEAHLLGDMLGELLGSALLGLALALGALRWAPERLPGAPLVVTTGVIAAAVGGLVTRAVLGPGHLLVSLLLAVVVAAAILSLLVNAEGSRRPHTGASGA